MRYAVDACNLIFQDSALEDTLDNHGFPAVCEQLVRRLSQYAYRAGVDEIIAVFDGSEKAAHRSREERLPAARVVLRYADPRSNADRAIIDFVESTREPGQITVVTNDKFIVHHVKKAGAHHLTCREFLRRMARAEREAADPLKGEDPHKYGGLSPREVEAWMKYFGFEEDE